MQAAVHAISISNAETIYVLGADKSYHRLFNTGFSSYFIGYSALVRGLKTAQGTIALEHKNKPFARTSIS